MRLTAYVLFALPFTFACTGENPATAGDTDADADTDTDSDTDTDTDADTDTDTDADTDTDPAIDCATDKWKDQTGDARGAWMQACVVPAIAPLFQEYDAERFADFGCATCHEGAGSYDYSMPSQMALDWSYSTYWADNGIYVGDGSGFMEKVAGTMTTLLEEQPYNAETGEGFGCYSCHQM